MKKTNDYYGILYAGIAMNEKNRRLLWDLICGYCNEWKKPTTIMGSYAGIVMNEKNQRLLWDFICGYCNVCIKSVVIKGTICGYCIYEMALWNL